MDRYFVDERGGCIAVRDRDNTNPDDQGLHPETAGVVQYWHGINAPMVTCPTCHHSRSNGYLVPDDVIQEANALCAKMNCDKSTVKAKDNA